MSPSKRPIDSADGEGSPVTAKKQKHEPEEFEPRSHQLAVYEVALRTNTIAVLETGSGKTMISVMLVKHFGEELKKRGDQRLILFLAPTVHLVVQQYETIKVHTDVDVQYCCGAKAVDAWSIASWQKEVSTYQVMVMTPQILLDVLRKGFLNLDMVHLMVIDECHHALGDHPYNKLMKEFYHKSVLKPHIFGMTASPILRKARNKITHFAWYVLDLLEKLGLVCAIEATKICIDAVSSSNSTDRHDFVMVNVAQCKSFLEEVLQKLAERLPADFELLLKTENDCAAAVQKGYISSKLYELIQIIRSLGMPSQVVCLIFVERNITAKVLERFIKKVCFLSHFTVSYLAGGSSSVDALTPKTQKDTLDSFRSGKANLLFTTDVAEEGTDVPDCSCVIRFDLPKTARSYIQSHGRARQAGSHYVIMLERGNLQQRDLLFDIIKNKHSTVDIALNRDQDSLVSIVSINEDLGAYYVDSTGASVTADSSVSLINTYCQNLPRDKYFTPKPIFRFTLDGGYYECTITLPPNAAIQTIVGPANQNSHVAKKLACLEACKRLHQSGALNDHLLPCVQEHLDDVKAEKTGESAKGAGTTKRKELHGSNFVPKRSNGKNVSLNHVHMPPELLVDIDVPYEVLKSFYLLPSLMYRVESLMLACQLRKEISFCSSNPIPSFLILEAITTLRCCEDFSMERLELLGDSVLKYAVSCSLFLKFPGKHEGKLSSDRIKIIRNATLHSLGTKRGIQGYIRDAAFEPRRWVAPGHISIHRVPCKCGLNDNEVPNIILDTISDKSIVIGKACDRGHRWLCSKTISDCVEALIGAYYVGGGLPAALAFIKWLGIDTEFEPDMVEEAIRTASGWTYLPKIHEIETLESKIGYKFTVKGLLLESITHASQQELGVFFCYQRLEFLGDSVLDLLITWHLFQRHKDIDPGELTDLRSASVNNENFAQVAVRHKLQQHLQHNSGLLLEQITEFVKRLEDSDENKYMLLSNGSSKVPKVLGDMVESIAGAILIDTKLDLDKVWEIFEPLLSPIATPENLELPPLRELTELCSHHGYFLNTTCTNEGDMNVAVLEVQLEDVLLVREGREKNKKAAKGQAAYLLLKDLEEKGFLHSRYASKGTQAEEKIASHKESVEKSGSLMLDIEIPTPAKHGEVVNSKNVSVPSPVALTVKMQKGGPRTALYELCKRCQWPMPSFETLEWKPSGDQMNECTEGGDANRHMFVSGITLHIPNSTIIKRKGDRRPDKKSSQDSAALTMLYELEKLGRCQIEAQQPAERIS
uniref:Dicer-like 3 n=1 Tax=Musa acuminata subsp. malaccensis TaxID=214687 RepID=A0A804L163_MUSAM